MKQVCASLLQDDVVRGHIRKLMEERQNGKTDARSDEADTQIAYELGDVSDLPVHTKSAIRWSSRAFNWVHKFIVSATCTCRLCDQTLLSVTFRPRLYMAERLRSLLLILPIAPTSSFRFHLHHPCRLLPRYTLSCRA